MDPDYINGLHTLLVQATSPDSTLIKAATATLSKDYYRTPQCIPALFQILITSQDAGIRQLAGVELRKRVQGQSGRLWLHNSQEIRNEIKTRVLESVLQEAIPIVRHTIARVIASIASVEMTGMTWPELLPWLYQCATAPVAATREIGVFIMYSLVDNVVDAFQEHLPRVYELFNQTIRDPESLEVRISTVRALGTLAQFIEMDDKQYIRIFQNMFPSMITVLRDCVTTNNSDGARHCFDQIETLLVLETPLIGRALPEMIELFLATAENKTVDEDIRNMAMNALIWTIKYRRNKLQQSGQAKQILERVMPIGCEDEPEDDDEDNPCRLCFRCIDTLATTFPPTQVFPTLHQLVTQYVASNDPSYRKCAMVAFGVAIEGCSEFIRPHVHTLWPLLHTGLQDGEWRVRKAACIALGCVCEFLGEEAAERHAIFLPVLLNLMNDERTRSTACQALDSYLECLGDHILPYLDPLMTQLMTILDAGDRDMKTTVVGAIGSAAHAAKSKFLPYFPVFMKRLEPFFFLEEEDDLELRSIAVDTAGTLAEAIGPEEFKPYFAPLMSRAIAGLQLESSRIHECNYLFFIVMSRVFPADMEPYLPTIVPELIKSCKEKEWEVDADAAAEITAGNGTAEAPFALKDDDIDVDEEAIDSLDDILNVSSAQAVEKEIAADAMGQMFGHIKGPFLPYVEQCLEVLLGLLDHFYEGIRKAAIQSLIEFVRTFYQLAHYEWIPGQSMPPVHENVAKIRDIVIAKILEESTSDDDKSTVATTCTCLAELITAYGPTVMGEHSDAIATLASTVLEQHHLCQQDTDQDETVAEEVPEDQAEYDSVLTSSAMDLVAALAHAYGEQFTPAFDKFLPVIAQYASKGRGLTDRSAAVGTFGEIVGAMGASVTPFAETLYPIVFNALSDEEAEVRSNAAYALGMLVENSTVDTSGQYMTIFGALRPFFAVKEGASGPPLNARDNACGAVSRMVLKHPQAVPLDQVLPTLLQALPLQNDVQENKPVFKCITYVYQTSPAHLEPYWDGLLNIFRYVLLPSGESEIDDSTRQDLIAIVRHLSTVWPDKVARSGLSEVLV